jgi:hypothetical protein
MDEDNGSGVKQITYKITGAQSVSNTVVAGDTAVINITTEGTSVVTFCSMDKAGNIEASQTVTINLDKTAPVITVPDDITAEATGPNGVAVTFPSPTVADNLDSTATVSCDYASGSVFPLGTTTVTCTSTDAAGNSSSKTFTVKVQDTTAPSITVPGNINAIATSSSGNIITFQAGATDLVDGTLTPKSAPASGSKFPLGPTTVNVCATDSHGTYSCEVEPIKGNDDKSLKAGSTIPIEFKLTGASACIKDATAKLRFKRTDINDTWHNAASSGNSNSNNLFRYESDDHEYKFNWSTKGLSAGCYLLDIDLGDGVTRTIAVKLR